MERFFDWEASALPIKRWRCPDCGAVHTMRPTTHWRRFWAAWSLIISSLLGKAAGRKWLKSVSRQRQQYWWRGYQIQSRISGAPIEMWLLLLSGRIVATHSLTYREIGAAIDRTYRTFAATTPAHGP